MMNFLELAKKRYSVRNYSEKKVEQTESSKTYSMPKSYVSYRKPRRVSEVQRQNARSKMKAINQAKNIVVN